MYRNHRVIGILAHVDAGKTTLAEGFLYYGGTIRQVGRVDHQDAFLDTFALERARGITIFSKQASLTWKGMELTLLDTPGHVDFSAEMERTLQVLDVAVLVVSGADGVQGHTQTLWGLLKRYHIPTFLFVNKMDQEGTDQQGLLAELQRKFDPSCVTFADYSPGEEGLVSDPVLWEEAAMCSEELMEEYLESGALERESIAQAIAERRLFPVFFGSALKLQGVETLLEGLERYTLSPEYPEEFGARVFKITRDKQGNRLTHLKVTGGILKAKQILDNRCSATREGEQWEEKADGIRFYNGASFQQSLEARAGQICAVTGLTKTFAGQGLGFEAGNSVPSLEPVLTYGLLLPEDSDPTVVLGQLRKLEEEDPLLHVVYKEPLRQIHVQVMGEVQIEILKNLILERFGLNVEFENGSIVYKETLAEPVIGIGHYEPLRHYAEVQLLMEPGERGSGMQFASYVSEDDLDRNWQRLILTHLEEKGHAGVLTGAEVTDLRISVVAGKAHQKHTEGGDFRQATYRAVRQGLRSARCLLLEPVFDFTLELPMECLGRAMTDIQRMNGSFETPGGEGETVVLRGRAPVLGMQDYQKEVIAYTRGRGHLSCVPGGYEPCHNAREVIAAAGYRPDGDMENPTGSVFCAHGAGFVVPWDEVPDYAHLPLRRDFLEASRRLLERCEAGEVGEGYSAGDHLAMVAQRSEKRPENPEYRARSLENAGTDHISLEEIETILAAGRRNAGRGEQDKRGYRRYHRSTYGGGSTQGGGKTVTASDRKRAAVAKKETCLLVDGYNVIFAWPELNALSKVSIASARDKLIDEMSNYQGYVGGTLILVYDAYKVKGNPGSIQKVNNIYVVYTKEAETADQYIEKTVHQIASDFQVTVATSDGLEQMIVLGAGATRMSSLGLLEDLKLRSARAKEKYGITE